MSEKLVLVTGVSGFVSEHCIKLLLDQGYRVRGTLRSVSEVKERIVRGISPLAADEKKLELMEADLGGSIEDWAKVVEGCEWIFHIAAPLTKGVCDPVKEMIEPIVDGTLAVLKAAARCMSVKKVVLTGTAFSCQKTEEKLVVCDPKNWADLETDPVFNVKTNAYAVGKVRAEIAAWKFWSHLTDADNKFDLTVILPALILGPILDNSLRSTPEIIAGLLTKQIPMLVNAPFQCTDVRDVALAHIEAAKRPEAVGKRILLCSGSLKMPQMAETLRLEFKPQGYSIASYIAPYWMIWLLSWLSEDMGVFLPMVDKEMWCDTQQISSLLGIKGRDMRESLLATAYSVIEQGCVKKTDKYELNERYYISDNPKPKVVLNSKNERNQANINENPNAKEPAKQPEAPQQPTETVSEKNQFENNSDIAPNADTSKENPKDEEIER